MGAKIFAVITVISITLLCIFNTAAVNQRIDELVAEVEASEDADSARAVREKYDRYERLISITVNHEDLTAINEDLCEILGLLSIGDKEGAKVTKSRLLGAFEHLRRLCNLNVDSVI